MKLLNKHFKTNLNICELTKLELLIMFGHNQWLSLRIVCLAFLKYDGTVDIEEFDDYVELLVLSPNRPLYLRPDCKESGCPDSSGCATNRSH